MKRGSLIAVVTALLFFVSCSKDKLTGSGPVVTETRDVTNFTKVSASGSSNVHISQGAIFEVEVKGYGNLLPHYETNLINGVLHLAYKQNTNVSNDNIEVFVTMPVLNGLNSSGSGNIDVTGDFSGNATFNANISGSGNIDIADGSAQQFFSTIAGSGNIKALDFVAEKAETETNGSGHTEITATSQLKVRISGSGNVYYKGNPAITTNISGSGTVIPR